MGLEKRRKKIQKYLQPKVSVVFNENERKDYLTGFRKRKLERRRQAMEQIIQRMKREKSLLAEKRKKHLLGMYHTTRDITDIDHLVEPKTYELPNHTVTISTLSDIDLKRANDQLLGIPKSEPNNDEKTDGEESEVDKKTDGEESEIDDKSDRKKQQSTKKMSRMARDEAKHTMKLAKMEQMKRRLDAKCCQKKRHRRPASQRKKQKRCNSRKKKK